MKIGKSEIGSGSPTFIIAEVSANHNQSFDRAVEIVRAAHAAGGLRAAACRVDRRGLAPAFRDMAVVASI